MKRTGFKQKPRKTMKRTPLRAKVPLRTKNAPKSTTAPKKRKRKTDLQKLKDRLWELCKQITRKRHSLHCYTCGKFSEAPHTGHFISSSVCSTEMRYDLDNLRPQCYRCNINLSGNWLAYEKHLIQDGINPQVLKDRNEATKGKQYDSLWYLAKIEEYKLL